MERTETIKNRNRQSNEASVKCKVSNQRANSYSHVKPGTFHIPKDKIN